MPRDVLTDAIDLRRVSTYVIAKEVGFLQRDVLVGKKIEKNKPTEITFDLRRGRGGGNNFVVEWIMNNHNQNIYFILSI